MASLDTETLHWIRQFIEASSRFVQCRSWQRGLNRVFEIRVGTDTYYFKEFSEHGRFECERFALRRWISKMRLAPTIVADRDTPRLQLLLTACPGQLVSSFDTNAPELPDIFRCAGLFLRSLHRIECEDCDSLSLSSALVRRFDGAARWAEQNNLYPKSQARAASLLRSFDSNALRRVPCHRDFSPRNWLFVRDTGQFSCIDFEHAGPDLPAWDLLRLDTDPLWERAELRNAFFSGYPELRSAFESRSFAALQWIAAMTTLRWAARHHDHQFSEKAHERLQKLEQVAAKGSFSSG